MERIDCLKLGFDIHNTVKIKIIEYIENNKDASIFDLRNYIHNELLIKINNITKYEDKGLAFPIGISGDSIVAHYTPIKMSIFDKMHLPYYLNPDSRIHMFDILKIDYGIQINGNIIDKAFSVNVNGGELEKILIDGSRCAVDKIKKDIGVDARLNELAASAREIIESYEYEGKPLKIVENVYSHNILPWKIHGDKFIKPDYINYNENLKVEAGEQYAIEFYTSNGLGKGKLIDAPHTYSHYRFRDGDLRLFPDKDINDFVKFSRDNLSHLPFCPNIVTSLNFKLNKKKPSHQKIIGLCQKLHNYNIVDSYPPIIECDTKSLVAQIEDNVVITNAESKILL